MKIVFADTSFYVALWNPSDRFHSVASSWIKAAARRVMVTEFVLLELGNFLSCSRSRDRFPELVRHLQRDKNTVVVPASSRLLQAGLEMYENRPDKNWSLTDCTSFVVMKEHGLIEALTNDHHFEQAGFTILLR